MPVRWRTSAIAVALLALWACAAPPAEPPPPAIEPIPLGPAGSRPIAFTHVVTRIPSGTLLGTARFRGSSRVIDEVRWSGGPERSTKYNVAVIDRLRSFGYRVLDDTDALFEPQSTIKIRYQLAGILHRAALDFEYQKLRRDQPTTGDSIEGAGRGTGRAEVDLELQLYDAVDREIVFKQTYTGSGMDTGMEPAPMIPAVVNAVTKALADPAFVRLVAVGGGPERASGPAPLAIRVCPANAGTRLPADLDALLDAVVVIQAGGSLGTGVIISQDGYVLTAAHVVFDLEEVSIGLSAGPRLPSQVLRRSGRHDIALLKLPGDGYPCAPLELDSPLPKGSDIFAINPVPGSGVPTVSRGVVSGYHEAGGQRLLQTDASVNRGSSGGPLFSKAGRVSGIVVRKFVGPNIEGISFAVPPASFEQTLELRWE